MISSLDNLSSALRTVTDPEEDDALFLAEKIKSDPQIQADLDRTGLARVQDRLGRTFVVKKRKTAAGAVAGT